VSHEDEIDPFDDDLPEFVPPEPGEAVGQKRVIIGVEVEAYSIARDDYKIGRRTSRPRPGLSERGERFTRDTSIGSEYNSRPFSTTREAFFLLKAGLRKYLRDHYRGETEKHERLIPLFLGGWTNRSAGTHMHISLADRELEPEDASSLAAHLHDQIPLLLAIGANSPIWDRRITTTASNRVVRGTDAYFAPLPRGEISGKDLQEMRLAPGRKTKPPTLELRVLDSNLPEHIVACLVVVKAVALRWLRDREPVNPLADDAYAEARLTAARQGMRAKLPWRGEKHFARGVLDRFLWEHRAELEEMDLPDEIWEVLKLLKRGYNGSRLISEATRRARAEHPQTWQRRFAKRYSEGLVELLDGNSLRNFAAALHVELPSTDGVWLGRRRASLAP
jgi:hypothetical protein